MRQDVRWSATAAALAFLAACNGVEPYRDPSIAFDKPAYLVTLSADGKQIVTKDSATVTVTRGSDPFPAYVFIDLQPTNGNCGAGVPAVGFTGPNVVNGTPQDRPDATTVSGFQICADPASGVYPRGVTRISAEYDARGKRFVANATITVQ